MSAVRDRESEEDGEATQFYFTWLSIIAPIDHGCMPFVRSSFADYV